MLFVCVCCSPPLELNMTLSCCVVVVCGGSVCVIPTWAGASTTSGPTGQGMGSTVEATGVPSERSGSGSPGGGRLWRLPLDMLPTEGYG